MSETPNITTTITEDIARCIDVSVGLSASPRKHLTKAEKEEILRSKSSPDQVAVADAAHDEFVRIWEEVVIPARGDDARKILRYLDGPRCDFFLAPASAKNHGAVIGGLVRHSLNVYYCLVDILDSNLYKAIGLSPAPSTIAVIALLHDLCKANFYTVEIRNRKTGQKTATGKDIWEEYPFIGYDDSFPYGHGEKSVYMASQFMRLTTDEAMAIRHHMGFSDIESQMRRTTYSDAVRKYPLCLALTEADGRAALIVEGYAANKAREEKAAKGSQNEQATS